MRNAIIVVGLGFGDEGKGAIVDSLCRWYDAKLVVRYSGGAQAGHNVVLADGRRFCFSQFGAGTFAGADTYIGPKFIVDLPALSREAAALAELGAVNPYKMLYIHPDALVVTPLHVMTNQAQEIKLGHGSCGRGIGVARKYWLDHGFDALTIKDILNVGLVEDKLALLKARLAEIVVDNPKFQQFSPKEYAKHLCEIVKQCQITKDVPQPDMIVFEGSQGVLLDEWYGFHPHTTWSTTTPEHAFELLDSMPNKYNTKTIGVTRAYTTRHGSGPLPTEQRDLTGTLYDEGNQEGPWQGRLRWGWLDLVLLEYAARLAKVDQIAVTWLDEFDRVLPGSESNYCCNKYTELSKLPNPRKGSLECQSALTKLLTECHPLYLRCDSNQLVELVSKISPVVCKGYGPTSRDQRWTHA